VVAEYEVTEQNVDMFPELETVHYITIYPSDKAKWKMQPIDDFDDPLTDDEVSFVFQHLTQ
jgi:hypothetical protein